MPAELFQSAPRARRGTSLLPLSIAAHAVGLAALVIAPILAEGELPEPVHPSPAYIEVKLPALPPVRRADPVRSTSTKPPVSNDRAAPIVAPPAIAPEPAPVGDGDLPENGFPYGIDVGGLPGQPVADFLPPPPPPMVPIRVGGKVQQPRKVKDVAPRYPELALQARVQGLVIIEAVIAADGRVRETRVLQSVPLLDRAALDAVNQWVFSPTRLNGEAVPVVMTVTVEFRLN